MLRRNIFTCQGLLAVVVLLSGAVAAGAEAPPTPTGSESKPSPVATSVAPSVLEIHADRTGWSCRIDKDPALVPDSSNVLVASLAEGDHTVTCVQPNAEPFLTHVNAVPGGRIVLQATFKQGAAVASSPPSGGFPPAEPEPKPPPPRSFEVGIGGGFAPSYGVFGVGINLRYRHFGIDAGTGTYPFGAALHYYFSPGTTGFYVTAGYLRIGHGLVVGGSDVIGSEIYASAGLDIRVLAHMSLKLGLGYGYEFETRPGGDGRGPLVFEISTAWLP